jgi:hypothetical protein
VVVLLMLRLISQLCLLMLQLCMLMLQLLYMQETPAGFTPKRIS